MQKYISIHQAAQKIGVCKHTIYRMLKKNQIRHIRINSRNIKIEEDFDKYLGG